MKSLKTIFCVLLIIFQSPSFILADSDFGNPNKLYRPCGYSGDMNCLENGETADASVINYNF